MIANATNLLKRPNVTNINNYRSPYGLQQGEKLIQHSQI